MQRTDFDVIVIGGGTAGAIAAVAAARSGARTCLVERAGHLGGTCFALSNITPFHNSRGEQIVRGLPHELVERIAQRGGAREGGHLPNPTGIGGAYELTRADVENGARFADAIARGAYPMSVQSQTQPNVREHLFVHDGGDYDIPYRSLVPQDIDGLLVAGRCLSATREAVGSARMGAQCMAYGHAAGVAAALAASAGVPPRTLDIANLRRALQAQHAVL